MQLQRVHPPRRAAATRRRARCCSGWCSRSRSRSSASLRVMPRPFSFRRPRRRPTSRVFAPSSDSIGRSPCNMHGGRAGVLHGDLGESFSLREPVTRALADALPVSLGLGAASLALTFLDRRSDRNDSGGAARTRRWIACSPWSRPSCTPRRASGSRSRSSRCSRTARRVGTSRRALRLPAFGIRAPGLDVHGLAALSDLIRHAILPVTHSHGRRRGGHRALLALEHRRRAGAGLRAHGASQGRVAARACTSGTCSPTCSRR